MSTTWEIVDNALTHDDLPASLSGVIVEPYPPFFWYISNGRLTHTGLPSPPGTGAFYGCSELEKVYIPESVKRIGEFAFAETALTNAKVAADCFYYDTSFPDGCEISYYSDYGEYTGAVPVRFRSDGSDLADWSIKGNTGGTGDRTANLFDKDNADIYPSTNISTGLSRWAAYEGIAQTVRIPCSANTTYAISIDSAIEQTIFRGLLINTDNVPVIENPILGTVAISSSDDNTAVFTTLADTKYLILQVSATVFNDAIDSLMLVAGSTPQTYEPYGYRIPVKCGGVTTNIYTDSPLGPEDSIDMAGTGIDIPTSSGINTLSVDTSVQPSEVYLKYKV